MASRCAVIKGGAVPKHNPRARIPPDIREIENSNSNTKHHKRQAKHALPPMSAADPCLFSALDPTRS